MLLQRCKCTRTPLATLAVFIVASLSWAQPARAALDATQVAILVNKDAGISSQVARMYQHLRGVPEANILRLPLGTSRHITAAEYWKAAAPVRAFLEAHPEIRCVLTTSGVPYTVQLNETTGIAFDNELAGVLRLEPNDTHTGLPNPLFLDGQNPYGINDPRRLKMVYVARLDGPDLATLRRMVEDAIAVEQTGLQGPVFGDAQGIDGITGYGLGDASIRQAMDRLSGAGFEAKLDLNQATWMQPKDGVGNEAAAAAFYIGWYSLRTFQDIFGAQGLARGAIAWHIASQEAENIWDANERGWCVNLMRRGAAVTLGPVREPYVQAFPRGDIFVE
ncbi:MAG TPA: TIGR03790 family protein, partial [Bryobacteraceae bacterium]|nr:TIGR03790 family protein [Bryobacteraceae bacterium]